MKRKKTFETPRILEVEYDLNTSLLGASVEANTNVISMGQEVVIHDFSSGNAAGLDAYWE